MKRRTVPGSRRDHDEAATDFFRAFQEIFERRFRWTVRQVLDGVGETQHTLDESWTNPDGPFHRERLGALGGFFGMIDAGIGGESLPAEKLAAVIPLASCQARR